jgi:folate-binding protein YgfZ
MSPAERTDSIEQLHLSEGAEFQAYGPVQIVATFGQPQIEYSAYHRAAALVDEPQRGFIEIRGEDRLTFLNNLLSNDTWWKSRGRGLETGSGCYAFFLNLKGRIVADVNVMELGDRTLIEVDARLASMLKQIWELYLFRERVEIRTAGAELRQFSIYGRHASAIVNELAPQVAGQLHNQGCAAVRICDVDAVVWRKDLAGFPSYRLVLEQSRARSLWPMLLSQSYNQPGRARKLVPSGWAAFNAFRIETSTPVLDIDFPAAAPDRPGAKPGKVAEGDPAEPQGTGVLPAETGLAERAVSYSKCYIGQEVVARMHARNAFARKIVPFRMEADELPIEGSPVFGNDDQVVGQVTSSTISPICGGVAIGLAMVKRAFCEPGSSVRIPAEGAVRNAVVCAGPFISAESQPPRELP